MLTHGCGMVWYSTIERTIPEIDRTDLDLVLRPENSSLLWEKVASFTRPSQLSFGIVTMLGSLESTLT
eukprot:scaffold2868_cov171-Amphora_coffeaeformis.AAC.19